MPDIFISYSHEDHVAARRFAEAFAAAGLDVWWDTTLRAGEAYDQVIETALTTARAVVVLWSPRSVESRWVRSEATLADRNGTLVPVTIEACRRPIMFELTQAPDLSHWQGAADDKAWLAFLADVKRLVGSGASSSKPAPQPPAAAPSAPPSPAAARLSICVLPFANISDDPQQEYFSDGISEDIITDLSKVSALSVVARNTAFSFKGKSPNVKDVASQLGVSHVLEGSVRKSGNRVRITAQLIDGKVGDHVWADRWDRDLDDIFALQDEISEAIVKALKLRLLPEEKKAIERRGTDSAEAYDLFLMARSYWLNGNDGDPRNNEAIERLCRRAVEIDPGYARAWAALAGAQSSLRENLGSGDGGAAALDRALALDPDLAEARATKARLLFNAGRPEEAKAEIAIALRLAPESYEVNYGAAYLSYLQGWMEDAVRLFEKAAALDDTSFKAPFLLVSCYTALGDRENTRRVAGMALQRAERVVAQDRSNGMALGAGAGALAALGEADRAKDWMRRALLVDPDNQIMRYNFGCTLAAWLGDLDAALDMLGPVPERGAAAFVRAAPNDPDLAGLRGDPRFEAMIAAAQARLAAAD